MSTSTPAAAAATDDAPVQGFSHCHEGILAVLGQLGELPPLADAAAKARRIAETTVQFFRDVVEVHHAEEEQELFPAVLRSAQPGAEHERVLGIVTRLTQEHRRVEKAWHDLEPAVRQVARGHDAALDPGRLAAFVAEYRGHASYEEAEFLPLCREILGRNGNHMAALGVSLHARHALPEVMRRFGSYL
jgi:hypothetical protein